MSSLVSGCEGIQNAFAELKKNINRCNLGRPMNILVLGTKGAGKSSLINTFAAALTDEFAARAQFGESGENMDNDTLTLNYTRFPNMGIASFELDAFRAKHGWNTDSLIVPNVYDIPGLPTSQNKGYVEVIRRVLYGLIDINSDLQYLYRIAEERGEQGIEQEIPLAMKIDPQLVAARRIDRVVIVVDAISDPDEGFLQMVLEAASPRKEHFHGDTFPYYCVMIKTDLIEQSEQRDEQYTKRKKQVLSSLRMANAEHTYFKPVVNYCDTTAKPRDTHGYDSEPKLNLLALRALCMITSPYVAAPQGERVRERVAQSRSWRAWENYRPSLPTAVIAVTATVFMIAAGYKKAYG